MTPTVVVLPHGSVVEPSSVGSSPPIVAVGPIPGVMAVLVILVTWLALIPLVASTASLSNPGTSVARLTGLKVVSATISHWVR